MTALEERAAWLTLRRSYIGGSDVAALAGLSPWGTPMSVWVDKTDDTPIVDDLTDNQRWGLLLEPALVQAFTEDTGLHVVDQQHVVRHPDHPHHGATLDGRVVDSPNSLDPLGTVQIKTTGDPEWDEIPDYYQVQVQWEMWCSGAPRAWLAVLHMGRARRFRIHEIERDDAAIGHLVRIVDRFWHDHVLTRTPPPVDGADTTSDAIRRAWPDHTPDTSVEIPADIAAAYLAAKETADTAAGELARITQQIQVAMGDAETATVDGAPVFTWKTQTSRRIDGKALRAAHPRAATRFETTTTSRVFRPVRRKAS